MTLVYALAAVLIVIINGTAAAVLLRERIKRVYAAAIILTAVFFLCAFGILSLTASGNTGSPLIILLFVIVCLLSFGFYAASFYGGRYK